MNTSQIQIKNPQLIIEELRRIIHSTVRETEERIARKTLNYKLNGVLTDFTVYPKHVSLGFSDDERKSFEDKDYKTGEETPQINFDQ